MPDKVLIDTSIWIEFFNMARGQVFQEVTQLLREDPTAYSGMIALELIRGAKTAKELKTLENLFQSIARFDEQPSSHIQAGHLGHKLAGKGITMGTVDLLIAQVAIDHALSLYTQDHRFSSIAKHSSLTLHHTSKASPST